MDPFGSSWMKSGTGRRFRGATHFRLGCGTAQAVGEIALDRVIHQKNILADDAERPAPRLNLIGAQVNTVHLYGPDLGVIEAAKQGHDGRLARPGPTIAVILLRDEERKLLEHVPGLGLVRERDRLRNGCLP